jgi:ATP-dependent Zn protease
MNNSINDLLVSWGPMIILIIVWLYFMKKYGKTGYGAYAEKSIKTMEESIVEMKLINEKLNKLIIILEKKK